MTIIFCPNCTKALNWKLSEDTWSKDAKCTNCGLHWRIIFGDRMGGGSDSLELIKEDK